MAFQSDTTNLVPGDTNGATDVFVRDRALGTTSRVDVSTSGVQAGAGAQHPAISPDGRYVAFDSAGMDLVPGDTNGTCDVFVRDLQAGTTERVSVRGGGQQTSGCSTTPAVSTGGRYVAFVSDGNLTGMPDNHKNDVYVRDRAQGRTILASASSASSGGAAGNGNSYFPSFSADNRYLAFDSRASNLVPGDVNLNRDVFVRNLQTGALVRASAATPNTPGSGGGLYPVLSADGRYVAFEAYAALPSGGQYDNNQVYRRDLRTGSFVLVSVTPGGQAAAQGGSLGGISADGRYVVFDSLSKLLADGPGEGVRESVYLRDVQAGTTSLVSVTPAGRSGNGDSFGASLSADARTVVFDSVATDLVVGDTNDTVDVFARVGGAPASR